MTLETMLLPGQKYVEKDPVSRNPDIMTEEETLAEKACEECEAPAEEAKPAEKPAPTSFNDMKSALDAIRARLKK